jgi:tellurite resistance protein
MTIWQAPFRPPRIRSKAVMRPHRSAGSGDRPGEAPQPMTPPDIIPLKRGFWAAYGTQTLACGVGLLLSLFFLWGGQVFSPEPNPEVVGKVLLIDVQPNPRDFFDSSNEWRDLMEQRNWNLQLRVSTPPEPEQPVSVAYTWLAVLSAMVMLFIPFFLFARWRRMEKIFGEDMYESDEGVAKSGTESEAPAKEQLSAEELLRRHPNRGQLLDGTQVGLTALLLACTAIVQIVVGSIVLFVQSPNGPLVGPTVWKVFAGGLVVQAAANLVLLVTTVRHSVGAPRLAFYVSVGGSLFSMITVHPWAMAACASSTVLMWRMNRAFQMMLARVAEPDKQDPLEAYYHNLLQLLVWVMRADGHCDRREIRKLRTTCDGMNLSAWERDVVLASANLSTRKELREGAKRYLQAATVAAIVDPGTSLLVVATAVAGADGVIVREEADAIRELAKLVGVSTDNVTQLLLGQQLHLEALDVPRAHELLNVDDGATQAQVQEAHLALATELEGNRYQHIGTTLAEQLHQRQAMLDRARDLLLKDTTA